MPFVPPWLYPPNFLQAMSEGGRLGLGAAEQATQANLASARLAQEAREAADRNMLGFANLSAERASTRQRGELAAQELANRMREMTLQQAFEQQKLSQAKELEQAQMAQTGKHQTAAEALRQQEIDEEKRRNTLQFGLKSAIQDSYTKAVQQVQDGAPREQIDLSLLQPTQVNSINAMIQKRDAIKKAGGPRITVTLPSDSLTGRGGETVTGTADELGSLLPDSVRSRLPGYVPPQMEDFLKPIMPGVTDFSPYLRPADYSLTPGEPQPQSRWDALKELFHDATTVPSDRGNSPALGPFQETNTLPTFAPTNVPGSTNEPEADYIYDPATSNLIHAATGRIIK